MYLRIALCFRVTSRVGAHPCGSGRGCKSSSSSWAASSKATLERSSSLLSSCFPPSAWGSSRRRYTLGLTSSGFKVVNSLNDNRTYYVEGDRTSWHSVHLLEYQCTGAWLLVEPLPPPRTWPAYGGHYTARRAV